jgi:hypothetical protein
MTFEYFLESVDVICLRGGRLLDSRVEGLSQSAASLSVCEMVDMLRFLNLLLALDIELR